MYFFVLMDVERTSVTIGNASNYTCTVIGVIGVTVVRKSVDKINQMSAKDTNGFCRQDKVIDK